MWSLKGFANLMAGDLAMSSAALYERQRSLVRAGLLEGESGKGPGSGVRALPGTVAMLLIAALAADGLSEVDSRTGIIAGARVNNNRCKISGAETFHDALVWAFDDPANASLIELVTVSRTNQSASILFRPKGKGREVLTTFGAHNLKPSQGIAVQASVTGDAIKRIADALFVTNPEAEWPK